MSETNEATEAGEYEAKLTRAISTVAGWLAHLIDPDQTVEVRALRVQDGTKGGVSTWAGVFRGDELPAIARAGLELSGNCHGVYYTLNPLKPDRFGRHAPRMRKVGKNETADDADVLARRWLLVDVDPVRAAGHEKDSATDGEKAAAWEVLGKVKEYVAGEGWPPPVVSDSGNGYHLLYKLAEGLEVAELPTPEDDRVRRFLLHLADKFKDEAGAKIDTSVFNPARIVKLPGTLACKGVASEERPHRRAKVLEVPG